MRHLTAAETKSYLDSVSLGEELPGSVDLGGKVVGIDIRGKPDLLDLYDMLLTLGILFLACLLIFVFTVIDNLAYGGLGIGGNLDQIKAGFLCKLQRVSGRSSLSLSLLFTFIASTRPGAKKQWRKAPLSHTCLSSSARIALTMLPVIPGYAQQHIRHKME